ncbi:MAG TPA: MAPEG family protein [Methyloceanibacter sp.]|nr:MAPEG family protein [Methyloceanibacter sp.]
MSTELTMLALSVALGLVQIILSAQSKNFQLGYLWAAGPRDEPRPPLTGLAGRLERALANFLETFPLFVAAVLIAHVAGRHDWMTVWGAQLYFWARLAYLPLYAFGIRFIRSLAWNVATLGIVLILVSLLT